MTVSNPTTLPTPDRFAAVDLTELPEENMAALRRVAIRDGISLAAVVARLVHEASDRLTGHTGSHAANAADPDGRAAFAAGRGLGALPKPEGVN